MSTARQQVFALVACLALAVSDGVFAQGGGGNGSGAGGGSAGQGGTGKGTPNASGVTGGTSDAKGAHTRKPKSHAKSSQRNGASDAGASSAQ